MRAALQNAALFICFNLNENFVNIQIMTEQYQ